MRRIECGGPIWAPVVARLAERHRGVVPDLPGLGESEPVDRLDPATFAAWFSALLRMTCDQPPALVAHSLGWPLHVVDAAGHVPHVEQPDAFMEALA
jgi:pimeloyl-ACP methyl ester carboxylesterase